MKEAIVKISARTATARPGESQKVAAVEGAAKVRKPQRAPYAVRSSVW
jgi:hypothetical protein